MRLYVELARRSFRQQLTYRGAALAGLFTNSIFGLMIAGVYMGLYASEDPAGDVVVRGWSADETLTLVWINQSLLMTVYMWGWWEVIRTIQSGSIVTDLLKPMDFLSYWLSRDLGRAAAHFLIRGLPTFAVGNLFFDLLPPGSVLRWGAFMLSILFAVVVSFLFRFMLNLAGFWIFDHRGLNYVAMASLNLLSGFLIPLAFFPGPLRALADALPFRAIIMIPNEIYLGQISMFQGLGLQMGWIAIMVLGARWIMSRGEKKVVIQGG
ncbi:MAG TPA: ABC-2 family transporter protein [Thermomicrobiales bacterium]|nr:ABC-2 family transporter protein [Thermomicrobiales bacterium]